MGKKNGTEQQQQEDLQLIYESLIPKNPELKEYGYDRFKEDMRDDNNLKDLFQSIAKKNPAVEQRGFEGFKSDMFPGQPDTVKKKKILAFLLPLAHRLRPRNLIKTLFPY